MCDLLGMCFNLPIRPNYSFKNFRFKDDKNPSGWGVAFYPDKSVQVIKESISSSKSKLSEYLVTDEEFKSKIIISHVRAASSGTCGHKNTHPFQRELKGKDYVFAHNGTLKKDNGFHMSRFTPVGETDSEHAFCEILNHIEKEKITEWNTENFKKMHKKLEEINAKGTFNCIFSDGEYLFCYSDKDQYNKLCFLERKHPFSQEIKLLDESRRMNHECFVNLENEKDSRQRGFIVATTVRTGKPTDETWTPFDGGELKVFKDGLEVYPRAKVELREIVNESISQTFTMKVEKGPAGLGEGIGYCVVSHKIFVNSSNGKKIKINGHKMDKVYEFNGDILNLFRDREIGRMRESEVMTQKVVLLNQRARDLIHVEAKQSVKVTY